jgi:cation:H+ antiporter
MKKQPLLAISAVFALTLPWLVVGSFDPLSNPSTLLIVGMTGLAIVGASFMLAWGAETAEKDVPRGFAIAILAVLAVAPEYAVDAYYAWNAGANGATAQVCQQLSSKAIASAEPGTLARACHDANLAVANMTGANRILIGLGWSGIALYTIYRAKRSKDSSVAQRSGFLADAVKIDRDIALEITFLLVATVYAFFIPLGDGIGIADTLFLVGLYVLYVGVIIRGDIEEETAHGGVPGYLQSFSKGSRVAVVLGLFAYSGYMIFVAVHPFAHSLETLGTSLGIPEFFMIQWIAPLASESPELIVVLYLVNKARSTAGFNALISSKLNQWTLLIGTLAVVYSIASGSVGTLSFDQKQAAEIWITAAQSFFALGVLVNFEIDVRESLTLLVLFVSQVVSEFVVLQTVSEPAASSISLTLLYVYTAIYVLLGVWLFARRRDSVRFLVRRATSSVRGAFGKSRDESEHTY